MPITAQRLWRVLLRSATLICLPLVPIVTIIRLLSYYTKLRYAAAVFIPDRKINFGNSLRQPDALRQVFYPDPTVFIVWREAFHNRFVPMMWNDLTYVSLPRFGFDVRVFGRRIAVPEPEIHDTIAAASIRVLVRILAQKKIALVNRDELIAALPFDPKLLAIAEAAHKKNPAEPFLRRFRNANYGNPSFKGRGLPVQLPRKLSHGIRQHLSQVRPANINPQVKLATIYTKMFMPGRGIGGPPIEERDLAIRELVRRAYQVLIVGDYPAPPDMIGRYQGMVVDARWLGMDPELFAAFAQTECDVYIADGGGGVSYGYFNSAPTMVMNLFPPFNECRRAVHYYNRVIDDDGRVLSFPEMVGKISEGDDWRTWRILPMTADEIRDAVSSFLDWVETSREDPDSIELAKLWPPYAPFHLAGCRLSSAYVRRYGHASTPVARAALPDATPQLDS